MKIYGDKISGNCLKVKYVADYLGLGYQWVDTDVVAGEARTPEMMAKNPVGQVPFIELGDGQVFSQSNAIMGYLADGSTLIPEGRLEKARMNQWLFWEQYSHETAIAVARFRVVFLGQSKNELDPELIAKGNVALDVMERQLKDHEWFVGNSMSLADIGLFAYTQFAQEPGFSFDTRPGILRWLAATRKELGVDQLVNSNKAANA